MIRVEDIAADPAFVRLHTLHGVRVDLRYVGSNNFAGRSLYGALDCAWLRREAAAGLRGRRSTGWRARRPGWTHPGAGRAAPAARAGSDLEGRGGHADAALLRPPRARLDPQLRHGRGRDAAAAPTAARPTWAAASTR